MCVGITKAIRILILSLYTKEQDTAIAVHRRMWTKAPCTYVIQL